MPRAASQGASAQLDVEVVALHPIPPVVAQPDDEVEVAGRGAAGALTALAGEPDPFPVHDAGRDLDLERTSAVGSGERHRAPATAICLLDGQLDLHLLISARDRAPPAPSTATTAEHAAEEIVDVSELDVGARVRRVPGVARRRTGCRRARRCRLRRADLRSALAPTSPASTPSGTWRKSWPKAS